MANQSGQPAEPVGDESAGSVRARPCAPATASTAHTAAVRDGTEAQDAGTGTGTKASLTAQRTSTSRGQQHTDAPGYDVSISPPPTQNPALHTPLALSTRSKKPGLVYDSKIRWEELEIKMSRNRPRGAARDNGQAASEEVDMWNKIYSDLRKAKEKNDRQMVLEQLIGDLNQKIARNGNKPTMEEIDELDKWHREMMKLSEEERGILLEEPADVIKNVEILMALRSASEADPQGRSGPGKPRKRKTDFDNGAVESPGPAALPVSDKLNRLKVSGQRSSSVSSAHARESVKVEEGSQGVKGTKGTVAEKNGHFFVGAEVVFKHNKKQQGIEGEGIQCIIKNITGEGNKRRYDVQDPEPIENGEEGAVYRTTAASLIPIPQIGTSLPVFSAGKQVLARYPDTTTFYRAEVMGTRKDSYRLKFEGEEDDKEMDVDRRFVLDIPGK